METTNAYFDRLSDVSQESLHPNPKRKSYTPSHHYTAVISHPSEKGFYYYQSFDASYPYLNHLVNTIPEAKDRLSQAEFEKVLTLYNVHQTYRKLGIINEKSGGTIAYRLNQLFLKQFQGDALHQRFDVMWTLGTMALLETHPDVTVKSLQLTLSGKLPSTLQIRHDKGKEISEYLKANNHSTDKWQWYGFDYGNAFAFDLSNTSISVLFENQTDKTLIGLSLRQAQTLFADFKEDKRQAITDAGHQFERLVTEYTYVWEQNIYNWQGVDGKKLVKAQWESFKALQPVFWQLIDGNDKANNEWKNCYLMVCNLMLQNELPVPDLFFDGLFQNIYNAYVDRTKEEKEAEYAVAAIVKHQLDQAFGKDTYVEHYVMVSFLATYMMFKEENKYGTYDREYVNLYQSPIYNHKKRDTLMGLSGMPVELSHYNIRKDDLKQMINNDANDRLFYSDYYLSSIYESISGGKWGPKHPLRDIRKLLDLMTKERSNLDLNGSPTTRLYYKELCLKTDDGGYEETPVLLPIEDYAKTIGSSSVKGSGKSYFALGLTLSNEASRQFNKDVQHQDALPANKKEDLLAIVDVFKHPIYLKGWLEKALEGSDNAKHWAVQTAVLEGLTDSLERFMVPEKTIGSVNGKPVFAQYVSWSEPEICQLVKSIEATYSENSSSHSFVSAHTLTNVEANKIYESNKAAQEAMPLPVSPGGIDKSEKRMAHSQAVIKEKLKAIDAKGIKALKDIGKYYGGALGIDEPKIVHNEDQTMYYLIDGKNMMVAS